MLIEPVPILYIVPFLIPYIFGTLMILCSFKLVIAVKQWLIFPACTDINLFRMIDSDEKNLRLQESN